MLYITGLDFTVDTKLFASLQNRGEEVLVRTGRKLLKSIRFPFVIIITCDRAEVVAEAKVAAEVFERALSLNPIAVSRCRYSIEGEEAEKHVFLLSSGVISPLFGEDTVQGQIIEAASVSRLIGSSSPALDKLFNMAAAFSKRMHTDYRLRVFDETIIDAVVARVEGKRRILIVGSGESARLVASALLPSHEVYMTLRDVTKTFLVPPGVCPVPYERRLEEAMLSDAVISASSGLYFTFSEEEISRLEGKELYDLSFPHDLPDAANVVRTEDLGVAQPLKEKMISTVKADAEKEIAEFHFWMERAGNLGNIEAHADCVAFEAMRRLSGVVGSLGLSSEEERNLRISILDSVRKAYISKTIKRK